MNLIQFVNKHDEAVEQGDVVVIGKKQSQSFLRGPQGDICPEVDLTDAAYDARACGIVAALYTELLLEEIAPEGEQAGAASREKEGEESGAKKGGRASKAAKSAADASSAQRYTPEEFESLNHTRVGPGQRGFMVVLGVYDHCKVDADIAPVAAGDLLTTSPTKGHAQKVLDPSKAVGAVIGKALGSLKKGKGKIPVLVTLQ